MPRPHISVTGLEKVFRLMQEMGRGRELARWLAPGIRSAANAVKTKVRNKNFEFRDRTGNLRATARTVSFKRSEGEDRVSGMAFGVYVGNKGRNRGTAYSVPLHFGHGGPRPARPYPFLKRAFDLTRATQYRKMAQSFERRFPTLIKKLAAGPRRTYNAGSGSFRAGMNSVTRKVSLRGRRR